MSVRVLGMVLQGLVVAAVMLAAWPAAAAVDADMVGEIVALCTAADTLTLDPDAALRRMAFRGGTPNPAEKANGLAYNLLKGTLTLGHVELSKTAQGWRVDTLSLLFGDDDKIALAALSEPLTKAFGAPQDATTGNTVLLWRGSDRVVRVTADVPGSAPMLVYVVTVIQR
jgi:hypothetical protein